MEPSVDEAHEAEEGVAITETVWPVRDLLPLELWFPMVLLFGFAIALVVQIRSRKKNDFKPICVFAVSLTLCLVIWFFYPSMNYQGTYIARYDYVGESHSSVVEIGDEFTIDGRNFGPYRVSPLQRMIWIRLPEGWAADFIPVKLGMHSISVCTPKVGWVKYTKQSGQGDKTLQQKCDDVVQR